MMSSKIARSKGFVVAIYSVIVVLLPIINQYMFGSIEFIDVFLVASVLLWLFSKKKVHADKSVIFYFLIVLLSTLVGSFLYRDVTIVSFILKMIKFALLFFAFYIVGFSLFDYKVAYKVYSYVIAAVTIIVFAQFFIFFVFGKGSSFLIPNITLNYMDGWNSNVLIASISNNKNFRPSSLFIEPGHQAEYIIPWLALSLFKDNGNEKKKNLFFYLAVSSAVLISASVTGIICVLFCWLCYGLLLLYKAKKDFNSFLKLLVLAVLAVVIFNVVISLPAVQDQIQRKLSSLNSLEDRSSLSLRVVRGYYCFQEIDLFRKIIGCGYNGFYYYYNTYGISTIYDSGLTYVTYMSGIFSALCNVGIIGFVTIFGYLLKQSLSSRSLVAFVLTTTLFVIMLGSDLFETPVYFIFVLFIVTISAQKKKERVLSDDYFNSCSGIQQRKVYRNLPKQFN